MADERLVSIAGQRLIRVPGDDEDAAFCGLSAGAADDGLAPLLEHGGIRLRDVVNLHRVNAQDAGYG